MHAPRLALLAPLAAALLLAGCETGRPAHIEKRHGLGGSSLVYVEPLDTTKTATVGRPVAVAPSDLAARFRTRLLQNLREQGMQTRDATGGVPRDGILVRGWLDTVDGGTTEGVKVGGQRIHCTFRLYNGAVDRDDPAMDLKVTGTPSLTEVTSEQGGILGAADDAADRIARVIRENP